MIDIKRKEKKKWFNFEEDEAYLLKFMDEDNRQKFLKIYGNYETMVNLKEPNAKEKKKELIEKIEATIKEFQLLVLGYILDWKGVFADNQPLECTLENKKLVFTTVDWWAMERFNFVSRVITNPNEFFNFEVMKKN